MNGKYGLETEGTAYLPTREAMSTGEVLFGHVDCIRKHGVIVFETERCRLEVLFAAAQLQSDMITCRLPCVYAVQTARQAC